MSDGTGALASSFLEVFKCESLAREFSLWEQVYWSLTRPREGTENVLGTNHRTEAVDAVHSELHLLNLTQSEIDNFVIYTFVRRYGWSEGVRLSLTDSGLVVETGVPEVKSVHKRDKQQLDKQLDAIIKWLSEQHVCAQLLRSFLKLVNEASTLPIVRNRSVVHTLAWLQGAGEQLNGADVLPLVTEFVLAALTDVWSAIRKVSCKGLGDIIDCLSDVHQETVWNSLVRVCDDEHTSWQAVDGAMLGISAIVQHLHTYRGTATSNQKLTSTIPGFIQRDILTVVFRVISHSQLPIRESAVKAVSAYISLVDNQESLRILEQTIALLRGGNHTQVDQDSQEFVDAYKAEGLLNVCQSVVKSLPLASLLPCWGGYLSSFLHHLAHPASSVRQSASSVFKLLVQKSSENTGLLCQLLHTLTGGWTTTLCDEATPPDSQTLSWEAKEGRMFAFEVICSFLIKNHIRKMFSRRKPSKVESDAQTPEPRVNHHSDRVSIPVEGGNMAPPQLQVKTATNQESPSFSVIATLRLHSKTEGQIGTSDVIPDKFPCALHGAGEIPSSPLLEKAQTKAQTKDCPSIRKLFVTILYQTMECLADNQWELRRIAQQVLPCLAEVIRWFDCHLVQHIWDKHLHVDTCLNTCLATYMCVFLLKESLYHCVRLEPLLQESLESVKTAELTASVRIILECVKLNTARYLPVADLLLKRPCFDRLSVTSAEVVIMAHRLFDMEANQKQSQCSAVLSFWRSVFVFAHPGSRITRHMLEPPARPFTSPYEGYLSCCLVKPEGDSQCGRQVEKVFVKTVCCHLQYYLSCLPWTTVAAYLPLVMYNIGLIVDDTRICKALLRCVSSQSSSVVNNLLREESSDRQSCLRCIYYCLREAAGIVTMKSLDTQLLQKVLNIYLSLCRAINPTRHLQMIFRGLCGRISKSSSLHESLDLSPRPDQDVSLLWQESPMLLCAEEPIKADLEEEEDIFAGGDLPAFYAECLSLNVSNTSGQLSLSGRQRTVSTQSEGGEARETEGGQDKGEESDDWDSWSDDDQDDASVIEMFSTFLHQLKLSLGQGAASIFDGEVMLLDEEERRLINRLVSD
ncbi:uncharacterized protein [Haliotis cracherodii]|uniref:uncharacterized protein n=1 Tax=Haliotis cracherodii TaxID=6455 RepID=UPI0039E7587F